MFLAVPRAFVVGLICAIVHNAIMIGGDYAGLHYALSLLISFLFVVAIGYRLHSGWTFRSAERSRATFTRYVVIASANLPSSLAGMFVFVNLIGLVGAGGEPHRHRSPVWDELHGKQVGAQGGEREGLIAGKRQTCPPGPS